MAAPRKFTVIWGLIALAALFGPMRGALTDLGYDDPEYFFEDLLRLVTWISLLVVPFCIFLALTRRSAKEQAQDKAKADSVRVA